MDFGKQLRAAREESGLRIEEVAVASGLTLKTLYHWERSSKPPKSVVCTVKLADALKLDLGAMVGGKRKRVAA